jgi:hypothetical protein
MERKSVALEYRQAPLVSLDGNGSALIRFEPVELERRRQFAPEPVQARQKFARTGRLGYRKRIANAFSAAT